MGILDIFFKKQEPADLSAKLKELEAAKAAKQTRLEEILDETRFTRARRVLGEKIDEKALARIIAETEELRADLDGLEAAITAAATARDKAKAAELRKRFVEAENAAGTARSLQAKLRTQATREFMALAKTLYLLGADSLSGCAQDPSGLVARLSRALAEGQVQLDLQMILNEYPKLLTPAVADEREISRARIQHAENQLTAARRVAEQEGVDLSPPVVMEDPKPLPRHEWLEALDHCGCVGQSCRSDDTRTISRRIAGVHDRGITLGALIRTHQCAKCARTWSTVEKPHCPNKACRSDRSTLLERSAVDGQDVKQWVCDGCGLRFEQMTPQEELANVPD